MRSNLFGEHLESTSDETMSLQNPRMLKVRLDGEVLARQGAMVAYQGDVTFAYEGAGGVGRFLKKALTGEGVPLMRCRGRGDVFLAQDGNELHVLDLDGDSVTVNGANVLAFEPGLTWDIRRVEGASALSGGAFNMVFTGTGRLVISAYGTPVVLGTAEAPTYADLQSAIAWTSTLQTRLVRTAGAGALIGRGSGEAFQLAFAGQGFVVVQASEGPVVPEAQPRQRRRWRRPVRVVGRRRAAGRATLPRRGTPRRSCRRATGAPRAVGARPAAEHPHVGAHAVQRRQRLADPLVGEVPVAVEREEVLPEPPAGGSRLDAREVDPAHRELGEQRQQRAGVVVLDEREQAGAVGAGRCGQRSGPPDEDEARDGPLRVLDVLRQRRQPVVLTRHRRGDGRVVAALRDRPRGVGGGRRQHDLRRGQVLAQPAPALRGGVRVGGHDAHVADRRARPDEQREADGQHHLAHHLQRVAVRELVEGGGDRPLDRVLDRHHRPVGLAGADGVERGRHGDVRGELPARRRRQRPQGGLGEGAGRAEEAQPGRRDTGH